MVLTRSITVSIFAFVNFHFLDFTNCDTDCETRVGWGRGLILRGGHDMTLILPFQQSSSLKIHNSML